ncbi:MAG: ABC transporter ATP-binding protein [Atopobiaceae bacterium]|nr:ABC transporter ATP-binding protein [Atopobiaceae bacterium]
MTHIHDTDTLHETHGESTERPCIMEFNDFCFAYDKEPVLRHITLSIHQGDSVVLMGDNGSGKSTLLKAMCGLIHPQQGSYLFNGASVDEQSMDYQCFSKRLHARIGFIFQDSDSQLFCPSVEDEIAFGPRQMQLSEDEINQRINDTLSLLGIEALRNRAPWTLSGGEKKRVAIACVLSMNPDVYCFDEPLAGLDAKTQEWLLGFLKQLKASGKTLIIATHDQSLADELADYFVYMGEYHGYDHLPHTHINL